MSNLGQHVQYKISTYVARVGPQCDICFNVELRAARAVRSVICASSLLKDVTLCGIYFYLLTQRLKDAKMPDA